MAVSTTDGYVSFYVIDSGRIRFANRIKPMASHCVDEILFLDNLKLQNQ